LCEMEPAFGRRLRLRIAAHRRRRRDSPVRTQWTR
jgi:hypothetical protein